METAQLRKSGSEGSEKDVSSGSGGGAGAVGGWVYHLGVNSIGREYCHLRYLFIRGKYVEMYKRDPNEIPGIKPIRKGVAGPTLLVQELGRRKVNDVDFYVLRFYNRLDEAKKGEIACRTAGEARNWMEAFDHAKQQAEYELSRGGSTRNKLNVGTEINLEGHRPRVRRYAHELKKLIKIGQGPETLLRQYSDLGASVRQDRYGEGDGGDAIDAHEWKCVRTINGIRIFEDVADSRSGKGVLVKSVGVVDATADTVFEVILNIDRHQRYEWDALTGDLELIDSYDGHYDVVYGTYDPKYLTRWHSKKDFVFSRQWFRGQDGTYTILQFPALQKKKPPRSGYRRTKINPSTWEIRSLNTPIGSNAPKCLVTQMLEIHSSRWFGWKRNHCSKFEKSVPYALLCQVAGLKEYIGANPALKFESVTTVVHSKISDVSLSNGEYEDTEVQDEFYDAIAADSSSSSEDEGSDNDEEHDKKDMKVKLKNVSWAIASLAMKRTSARDANKELDPTVAPTIIDPTQFHGSLHKGKDDTDTNCWTSPSGTGFMIRGKTYLKDNMKVMGGDPLLKLIAVDWFKVDQIIDRIALHPRCLVQSEVGKKLPFIVVINLQVPGKPNYCLVLYYAADRPVKQGSLLAKFVDGSDMFRDARFKLIPSIVEGYWMVKRAVGTKACLLGKAVTCKYLRQELPDQHLSLLHKMSLSQNLSIFFSLFITLSFGLAHAAKFDITNNCPFTVWAGAVPVGGGRQLNQGETWSIDVNAGTTGGRIWPRTGCTFDGSGRGSCQTGDCGGLLQCQAYGTPPNTLAEFGLNQFNGLDFFDISLVDGFNVAMDFSPTSSGCTRGIRCTADINGQCPNELKAPGGCNNPCTVFKTDQYCCNSGSCEPTDFSKFFKNLCPDAYSYPKDDATSTFTCPGGTNYKVVFCP